MKSAPRILPFVKGLTLAYGFATLFLSCGVSQEHGSGTQSLHPGQAASGVPLLGAGFDSLSHSLTGSTCFEGFTVEHDKTSSARLDLKADVDARTMRNMLAGDVGVTIPVYPGIAAKGALRFASDAAKNDFSSNVVVSFKARTGGHRLHFDGNSIRPSRVMRNLGSEVSSAAARTPYAREICGQHYVSYVEMGVSLVAVLKIEFQNEYDRKAMGGSLGASILGGLIDVGVSTDFEAVLKKSGVKITLSAVQEGGNPALLNSILGGGGDGSKGAMLECSAAARATIGQSGGAPVNPCIAMFKNVLVYAEKLRNQIESGQAGDLESQNTAILKFESLPYPAIPALAEIVPGQSNEGEISQTNTLLQPFQERLSETLARAETNGERMITNLQRLKGIYEGRILPVFQRIEADIARTKAIAQRVGALEDLCWPKTTAGLKETAAACAKEWRALERELEPGAALHVSRDSLSPLPQTISEWCVLNLGGAPRGGAGVSMVSPSIPRLLGHIYQSAALATPQVAEECKNVDRALESLTFANLSGGFLDDLSPLSALHQLVEVDLSENGLTSAPPLALMPNLKVLRAARNSLSDFSSFVVPDGVAREELDLSGNRIEDVNAALGSGASRWRKISIAGNLLTSITQPVDAPDLQLLDLSNNPFLTDVSGFAKIRHDDFVLILKGTGVSKCPFATTESKYCVL